MPSSSQVLAQDLMNWNAKMLKDGLKSTGTKASVRQMIQDGSGAMVVRFRFLLLGMRGKAPRLRIAWVTGALITMSTSSAGIRTSESFLEGSSQLTTLTEKPARRGQG